MKSTVRIILALSFSLAACGRSQPELFLDRATTALECGAANASDCAASEADAGAPQPEVDECYGDGDCEYAEVCERRHGVSRCQPGDGRHGDAGYGDDSSSDDSSSDDSSSDDSSSDDDDGGHGGADRSDAGGAACGPAYAANDHPKGSDDCSRHDEDRSGSNSGRH